MKIDDPDSLKKWLVQILTPIFDGDPDKLALYIVALAKKVENDLASRQRCIEDLEVFLEEQTNGFVNQLFDALLNKSYLAPTGPASSVAKEEDGQTRNPTGSQTRNPRSSRDHQETGGSYYHHHHNRRSTGGSAASRPRSRSIGRRRGRNRSRGSRLNRGSSSSSSSSPSPIKRRSRSRSGSRSRSPIRSSNKNDNQYKQNSRNKSRCRDYDEKGYCAEGEYCPFEHSNAVIAPNLLSANQSSQNQAPPLSNNFSQPPHQSFPNKRAKPNNGFQPKFRPNEASNEIFNISNSNPNPILPPNQPNLNMIPPQPSARLPAPVQIQTNRPRNLVNVMTAPPNLTDDGRNGSIKRPHPIDFPQVNQPPPGNFVRGPPGFNTALLPTPPMPPSNQPLFPKPNFGSFNQSSPKMNPNFMPPNLPINIPEHMNSSLVVRKIPVELNRVDAMGQHFGKFGPIVDIQCNFENNQDAALVVFANNQAAQAAYKCPQPVFNNRFIRLFWLPHHLKVRQQKSNLPPSINPMDQSQPHVNPNDGDQDPKKPPAKERLSLGGKPFDIESGNKPGVELTNKENQKSAQMQFESLTKTIFNQNSGENTASSDSMEVETSSSNLNISQLSVKTTKPTDSNLVMARQIQNENHKKALLLKMEVQKKARELMEKQIKDQKVLLEKFDKAKTQDEKNQILELIKKISDAIEKEKEILNDSPVSKTRIETHARVTPAPHYLLKLNNKRLNTTSFLKGGPPKLPQNSMSPSASSPSSFFNFSKVSVDNRPRKLILSGLQTENEKNNIVNFISALGINIESVDQLNQESDIADNTFSILISFVTRKDAEIALLKCSNLLTNKKIKIAWFKSETKPLSQEPTLETPKLDESGSQEMEQGDKSGENPKETNLNVSDSLQLETKQSFDENIDDFLFKI